MATARNIITRSLQKIGALVKSEAPSADEAQDGLFALNAMIGAWSNESLLVYARVLESFLLTGSQEEYTIGVGGNINTSRPIRIVDAYVRSGSIDYPMVIITDEAYDDITYKKLTGIPEFLQYTNEFPIAKIRIYTAPSAAYTLFLLSEKELTQFSSLDQTISLPPGFEEAIVYNLAIRLAPDYNETPPPSVVQIAKESLGSCKLAVAKVRTMDYAPKRLAVRNIYTGWRY